MTAGTLLPEVIILVFALAALIIDLTLKRDYKEFLGYFSGFGLFLALIFEIKQALSMKALLVKGEEISTSILDGMIVNDLFAVFFKLVFLLVALFVVFASIDATKRDKYKGEYYSLVLFATLGMMLVAMAGDLILLFVSLELASLSSYAIVALRKNRLNTEAAVKYFVVGALSSAIILFSLSLLYGIAGTTKIYELGHALPQLKENFGFALALSMLLLIVGFGYKIAAFPFHFWAPDVYQGAPSTVSAFLSAASKKMGFVALIRLLTVVFAVYTSAWSYLLGLLAIFTMFIGNFSALKQHNIKRMLAYSSVAQAGYVLVPLALISAQDIKIANLALASALLHVFTHAMMKGGAFLAVASATARNIEPTLSGFRGLGRRMPLTALTLAIFLLSLAGIPFLAGFISKLVIVLAAVGGYILFGNGFYIVLALMLVINSVASLYYYGMVIKAMYFDGADGKRITEPGILTFVLVVLAILVVIVGVAPDGFIKFSLWASSTLFKSLF